MKEKLGKYITEYSKKNKDKKSYPVYSVTNRVGFCTEYFTKDVSSEDKSNYKIVPYGYFAYNPSRINVGSIDWQHCEENVLVSPLYTIFKCSEHFDQRYLQYYFKSPYCNNLINSSVSGSVRANLKFKTLSQFIIDSVDIDTQKSRIADLDLINKGIKIEESKEQKLNELIDAKFVELFGNPQHNNKNLAVKRLDEICTNLDHKRIPITAADRKEGSYPYYGASGIVDYVEDYIFDEDILLISEDGANLRMRNTPIAFSVKGKCWVNNHAHVVKFDKIETQIYVEHYIEMVDISDRITGSAQPKLNQAKLNSMPIAIPNFEDQVKFYEFVCEINKLKDSIKKNLSFYKELLNKKLDEFFN